MQRIQVIHNELFTADTANVTLKKYFRDRAVVKADVDAMIGKIRDESDALAAKNTITVPDGAIGNNNHFTIDTTGYADDDVIYVSVPAGSKLEDIIKTTEGLTIKKSANQMVVFNFETKGEVNINKIAVEVDGKRITSDTVNQQLDNEHNKDVDNYIIRKIIWNANQASKLNVDMGAGMFLVPRGDAHCQNASAGWLATGGTVTANGEWHFAFRQRQFMTDGSIKFEGRKELVSYKDDGTAVRLPISQNQFKFTLYRTDNTYDTTGSASQIVQEHLGNSATSAVQFQDLGIKESDLEYDAATGKYTKVLYYVVREELPDMLITDIAMPRMDGLELMRNVRADETMCCLPIVVVSARVEDHERLEGISAGAEVYLAKPFINEELLLIVNKLLEQRKRLRKMFANSKSDDETSKQLPEVDVEFFKDINKLIDANLISGDVSTSFLADKLNTSVSTLNRRLKNMSGLTATTYIRNRRILMAKRLLETTDQTVSEIEVQCGFNTSGHFSRVFKAETGISPLDYRHQSRNQ